LASSKPLLKSFGAIFRRQRKSLALEPLAKPHLRVLFISQREAKLGSAGGHFWHDEVSTPTS
jgi:hypothetical protein